MAGSASIRQPVHDSLRISHQLHIPLPTPRLSCPTINGVDIFQKFRNDTLTQLLVDDMSGFGRSIEVLYSTMEEMASEVPLDLVAVLKRTVDAMRQAFPKIELRMDAMREAFLAAVAHRFVVTKTKIGDASLDDVTWQV